MPIVSFPGIYVADMRGWLPFCGGGGGGEGVIFDLETFSDFCSLSTSVNQNKHQYTGRTYAKSE